MLVQCMNQDGAPRAVDVEKESRTYGWVFSLHPDGQWVTLRKATEEELTQAENLVMFFSMLPERVDPVQASHTKEPWSANFDPQNPDGSQWAVVDDIGFFIADCHDNAGIEKRPYGEANARRIVACVNACAGIPTEKLESIAHVIGMRADVLIEHLAQRDELQAKWNYYQGFVKEHGAESITDLVVQRDELLALVKGFHRKLETV